MPSDLEGSLVEGGLSPALAKVISNAIANAASSQLSLGRRFGDATPASQMRMVDRDTRRYVLTNLDHRPSAADRTPAASAYRERDVKHPYTDSQPATAQPTISTPAVVGGAYIAIKPGNKDQVSQSTVSVRTLDKGGRHARLDTGAGVVEAVPFSVEIDQKQCVEASFEERPEGTVLRLRLKNLEEFTVNGIKFLGWKA